MYQFHILTEKLSHNQFPNKISASIIRLFNNIVSNKEILINQMRSINYREFKCIKKKF